MLVGLPALVLAIGAALVSFPRRWALALGIALVITPRCGSVQHYWTRASAHSLISAKEEGPPPGTAPSAPYPLSRFQTGYLTWRFPQWRRALRHTCVKRSSSP